MPSSWINSANVAAIDTMASNSVKQASSVRPTLIAALDRCDVTHGAGHGQPRGCDSKKRNHG
jgi:hypothetical protein